MINDEDYIKPPSTSKRLKESEWLVLQTLWERGDCTLKDLSDKFGISIVAISRGLNNRGAVKGSQADTANHEFVTKIRDQKKQLLEEVFTFKKRYIKYGDFLMNLAMSEITEAKKRHVNIATIRPQLQSIKEATAIYKTVRHDMFHLYGLYDEVKEVDETLPEFNIGVYTEADIDTIREGQKMMAEMIAANNAEFEQKNNDSDPEEDSE